MKQYHEKRRKAAFNVIELIAVIAIICLIVATLKLPKRVPLPVTTGRNPFQCMNNQRQIADAFLMAVKDHDDQFPWETPNGMTKNLLTNNETASQFQALSGYVRDLSVFICPSDRMRQRAMDYKTMNNSNISYFLNVDAKITTNSAHILLTGDRHLETDTNAVMPGLFIYTNGMSMGWTRELHGRGPNAPAGTVSFADGHQERVSAVNSELTDVFNRQNLARARLLVP